MREVLTIEEVRAALSREIEDMQSLADKFFVDKRPICGAELTLAIRHLQDARMRLGVALTIEKGENPWTS